MEVFLGDFQTHEASKPGTDVSVARAAGAVGTRQQEGADVQASLAAVLARLLLPLVSGAAHALE